MRSTVIAAITSAATTSGRRDAPSGFTVMSGAIVTAALFPELGGGVNVAGVAGYVGRSWREPVGWAKRSVPTTSNDRRRLVGTAQERLCPPYDTYRYVTLSGM